MKNGEKKKKKKKPKKAASRYKKKKRFTLLICPFNYFRCPGLLTLKYCRYSEIQIKKVRRVLKVTCIHL